MKKLLLIGTLLLPLLSRAQAVPEQVWVSTDRNTYVAGDCIWVSAFCFDATASGRKLSAQSKVAYVELLSSEGTAATMRLSLLGGRGGGVMAIPGNVPTGTYLLAAYTRCLGKGVDPLAGARRIRIFNTNATIRQKTVQIADHQPETEGERPLGRGVQIALQRTAGQQESFPVTLQCASDASVSVSVYKIDALEGTPSTGPVAPQPATACPAGTISTLEGEILTGHLEGRDAARTWDDPVCLPLISAPGNTADIYLGEKTTYGSYRFRTGNIFGRRDLVCEVLGLPETAECSLVIDDPFLHLSAESDEPLVLSEDLRATLQARRKAMIHFRAQDIDTLVTPMPARTALRLDEKMRIGYHLADYTKMTSVQEMIIEFIPELRVRRDDGKHKQVQVRIDGGPQRPPLFARGSMTLLDGVPMTYHENLLAFDPDLLSDILIYPHTYNVGTRTYDGVVNFITAKGNISTALFPKQVRIFDFDGICPPVILPKGTPDCQTLYWHPLTELQAGKSHRIEIQTPAYKGRFRVVVEGLTQDGTPLYTEASFETL